jgi:hypothetical protein
MTLTYHKRIEIGNFVEGVFVRYLKYHKLGVIEVAESLKQGLIAAGELDQRIKEAIRSDAVKRNKAIIMCRYMPDFLLLQFQGQVFGDAMFCDVKAMFTPVFLDTFHKQLEQAHGANIALHNVANIEREAFDSYRSYQAAGAKVSVLLACSYHPELALCEYIENIRELYRDVQDRNQQAAGSTTPRVNIDLSSMRPLQQFLKDEFDVDAEMVDKLHSRLREKLDFVACPQNIAEDYKERVREVVGNLSQLTGVNLRLELI